MKKFLMTSVSIAALTSMASAADLGAQGYTKAPAPVVPIYNWTGFYVGAHLGGAWSGSNDFDLDAPIGGPILEGTLNSRSNNGSVLGGGQIGADYQFSPNFLIGVEGQISGVTNNSRSFTIDGGPGIGSVDFFRDRSDWLGSVTGRLGYVSGPALFYVKGGVAFRDNNGVSLSDAIQQSVQAQGGWSATERNSAGYTVGGGLEYMFAPAWSTKVEYQYYNFGTTGVFFGASGIPTLSISYRDDIHTLKAGINYHFNWAGPIAARY